jgi:hypothetical protein
VSSTRDRVKSGRPEGCCACRPMSAGGPISGLHGCLFSPLSFQPLQGLKRPPHPVEVRRPEWLVGWVDRIAQKILTYTEVRAVGPGALPFNPARRNRLSRPLSTEKLCSADLSSRYTRKSRRRNALFFQPGRVEGGMPFNPGIPDTHTSRGSQTPTPRVIGGN